MALQEASGYSLKKVWVLGCTSRKRRGRREKEAAMLSAKKVKDLASVAEEGVLSRTFPSTRRDESWERRGVKGKGERGRERPEREQQPLANG